MEDCVQRLEETTEPVKELMSQDFSESACTRRSGESIRELSGVESMFGHLWLPVKTVPYSCL